MKTTLIGFGAALLAGSVALGTLQAAEGERTIKEQRAWEQEQLTSYEKLDNGHYRMPIAEAMALLAKNPALLGEPFDESGAPAAPAEEVNTDAISDDGNVDNGEALFQSKICFTCHTTDGSPLVGPSFKGLWGRDEHIEGQDEALTIDKAYVIDSIRNPNNKVVKGFVPTMPPMPMTDEELGDLIAYLKTL